MSEVKVGRQKKHGTDTRHYSQANDLLLKQPSIIVCGSYNKFSAS